MKRLLLTLTLFTPALMGMESPLGDAELKENQELVIAVPVKEKLVPFDIKKYVNVKKLLLSAANTLFTDEKESSDSSSDEGEEAADSNDTLRQLINALINALKLEQRVLTIGLQKQDESKEIIASNENVSPKTVATGKQVKLKRICDLTKFRRLLTDINDNYFEKGDGKTNYAVRLVQCINWKKLKEILGAESDEFTILNGAAEAIVAYSKNDSTEVNITEYLHIQKITKLLFGFELDAYADMPAFNKLINLSFKKEALSLDMYVKCIKPEPLLLFLGCPKEDIEVISATLQGLLTFAYDLAQDEGAAIDKMLSVIELYGQYDPSAETLNISL